MEHVHNSGSRPYEDRALKATMNAFVEDILPFFGVNEPLEVMLPTESVMLEMKVTYADCNLKTKRGVILHLEFQSSNEGAKGLRKYRFREAALSDQHQADVITYVIYSGNVKHPTTELKGEENSYTVRPVILRDKNADEVVADLEKKLKKGDKVEREDVIRMVLTPLMGGEMEQYERMESGFRLVKQCESYLKDADEVEKFQAVLYTFSMKFLNDEERERLEEKIKMSDIIRSMMEDAMRRGREEGREEGSKMANRKSIANLLESGMPPELVSKLLKVSNEEVEDIQGIKV